LFIYLVQAPSFSKLLPSSTCKLAGKCGFGGRGQAQARREEKEERRERREETAEEAGFRETKKQVKPASSAVSSLFSPLSSLRETSKAKAICARTLEKGRSEEDGEGRRARARARARGGVLQQPPTLALALRGVLQQPPTTGGRRLQEASSLAHTTTVLVVVSFYCGSSHCIAGD